MNSEGIAHILCDQPLSQGIVDRIEQAFSNQSITGLVLDFRNHPQTARIEVDQILTGDPWIDRLRSLIRQMEQGPKAVAALIPEAISGLQFELALGCHVRFARVGTHSFDFPYLKYGLMPILGGTQRLPRLGGIELAARLLLYSEKVSVLEAAASGLCEITGQGLPEAASQWIEAHPKPAQPWDQTPQELSLTYSQKFSNRQLLEKIYLKLRHRVSSEEAAPTAILRCLQDGLERSIDAGIRLESEQWSVVRRSRSTLNRLKTLHVARQKATLRTANRDSSLEQIGVLGGGLMGTGIAYAAARAGYEVVLVEVSGEASERSVQRMKKVAQQDAASGLLKAEKPADLLNRVRWEPELAALKDCDFIVEAIFEREALKKENLAEISALVHPTTTIASNTTTLPISGLAVACNRPEQFIGTHFFAPVDRMELLEIIVGEKTSSETLDRALVLATALGKTPIVVRDGPGFFTSRVVAAYLQEALFMMHEGISPWMIDNVAQNAGMFLGPLTVADLMSLDLLFDIFQSLAIHCRGAAKEAAVSIEILQKFLSQSHLGRKTGAGIYEYGARLERADLTESSRLFAQANDQTTANEIEQRLFVIQSIEALHAMSEGIIEDPAMADLASVLGWSYPAGRGGVISYLDFLGQEEFERVRRQLEEKFGNRFAKPDA